MPTVGAARLRWRADYPRLPTHAIQPAESPFSPNHSGAPVGLTSAEVDGERAPTRCAPRNIGCRDYGFHHYPTKSAADGSRAAWHTTPHRPACRYRASMPHRHATNAAVKGDFTAISVVVEAAARLTGAIVSGRRLVERSQRKHRVEHRWCRRRWRPKTHHFSPLTLCFAPRTCTGSDRRAAPNADLKDISSSDTLARTGTFIGMRHYAELALPTLLRQFSDLLVITRCDIARVWRAGRWRRWRRDEATQDCRAEMRLVESRPRAERDGPRRGEVARGSGRQFDFSR